MNLRKIINFRFKMYHSKKCLCHPKIAFQALGIQNLPPPETVHNVEVQKKFLS